MPPINLLIKPASSLCNMRCRYCFYADVSSHREVPSYGIMSGETLRTLTERALAHAEGFCGFAFQGGEPTVAGLDFFRQAVALQKELNTKKLPVHNAIQTNGLVIDDEWAAFLAENRFLVGLSLDGDAKVHNDLRPDAHGKGTYGRVMRAAQLLQKHGCEYNILCVISSPVARHAGRVYDHLKRHRYLQFIPCIDEFEGGPSPLSLSADQYAQFLKVTFDRYYHDYMAGQYTSVRTFDNYVQMLMGHPAENCAMNGTCTCNIVVEGDGSIYPCDFYVLDRWRLGNIRQDELPALLASETAAQFVESSRAVPDECRACQWAALCRGGCRRDREALGQEGLGLNRFCEAYKAFFSYGIDRLREMARVAARG